MINRLYHAGTGATVQFSAHPLRGSGDRIELGQTGGYDSAGATYVYSHNSSRLRDTPLVYPQQSAAVRDALLTFLAGRNGDRVPFTWYDHDGAAHTVRFTTGHVASRETTTGRYRLEFALTEVT